MASSWAWSLSCLDPHTIPAWLLYTGLTFTQALSYLAGHWGLSRQ